MGSDCEGKRNDCRCKDKGASAILWATLRLRATIMWVHFEVLEGNAATCGFKNCNIQNKTACNQLHNIEQS
eukprot:3420307-Amphidinium_carterae.1